MNLSILVRCPDICRDLPLRACLRRQSERHARVVTIRPATSKGLGRMRPAKVERRVGDLKREACGRCAVGALRLAMADQDGIAVRTCRKCGAGLVGVTDCDACRERESVLEVPRGILPPEVMAKRIPATNPKNWGWFGNGPQEPTR